MDQLVEFAGNNIVLAGIWIALVGMLIFSYISAWTSSVKEVVASFSTRGPVNWQAITHIGQEIFEFAISWMLFRQRLCTHLVITLCETPVK